jgi:hypothetical protein
MRNDIGQINKWPYIFIQPNPPPFTTSPSWTWQPLSSAWIPRLLKNPKAHYRIHKSPYSFSLWSAWTHPTNFDHIHFTSILTSTYHGHHLQMASTRHVQPQSSCIHFLSLHWATCPAISSYLPNYYTPKKLLIILFSPFFRHFLHLISKYSWFRPSLALMEDNALRLTN